jgi:hypothetical protein
MPSRRAKAYRAKEIRRLIQEFKAQGCRVCGEQDPCCLTAHHLDPAKKRFSVSPAALIRSRIGLQAIRAELAGCTPLCANCHQKHNHAKLEIPCTQS